MENIHFVYALDCGTYDADGTPLRIFGVSSLETFAGRYRQYGTTSPIFPVLCGVIPCESKEDARAIEKVVLSRLWKATPPARPKTEIRRGTPDVLEFIATEMDDGETFLGMTAHDYMNRHFREAHKEYQRDYRKRPEDRRAHTKEKKPPYHQRPDVKERQRNYQQRPDVKERHRKSALASYHRRKRGGKSPGQLSFL